MDIFLEFLGNKHPITIYDCESVKETVDDYIEKELMFDKCEITFSLGNIKFLSVGDSIVISVSQCNDKSCTGQNIHKIIEKGHLSCLKKCLLEITDTSYCSLAARYGHLRILKWLRDPNTGEGRSHWCADSCSNAAQYGQFEVLKWLRNPGTISGRSYYTCDYMSAVPKWSFKSILKEDICDWDSGTCYWAALKGHFEILEWALDSNTGEGKCIFLPWAINAVFKLGNNETINWMYKNNYVK